MHKWKLMVSTLPVPIAAIGLRFLLEYGFKLSGSSFPGILDFSALSPVLTGGVFLIGLMLSGTLQDYKESEKIPAELACCLETMEETVGWVAANRPAVDERAMRQTIAHVSDEIYAWLLRQRTPEQGFATLEKLNELVRDFDKLNAGLPASRFMSELHNLRKILTRIGVISRTGFLASGYALLDILVGSVLVLLLMASYKVEFGTAGKYIIIGFVSLIYCYLWRLVKDVDDPFEYAPDGGRTGAAEVELFPLLEYRQRAQARLIAMGPAAGADLELPADQLVEASGVIPVEQVASSAGLSGTTRRVVASLSIVLLLVGGVAVWFLSHNLSPNKKTVRWSVSSAPPGAEIFDEAGKSLGHTPFISERAKQPGSQMMIVRLSGFQESRLVCHGDSDCVVETLLTASPPPPAPEPPPAELQPAKPAGDADQNADDDSAAKKRARRHSHHHKDELEL